MSSAKEGKLDLQPLAEDDLHVALHPTAKVQTCGLRETGPKSGNEHFNNPRPINFNSIFQLSY